MKQHIIKSPIKGLKFRQDLETPDRWYLYGNFKSSSLSKIAKSAFLAEKIFREKLDCSAVQFYSTASEFFVTSTDIDRLLKFAANITEVITVRPGTTE